MTIHGRSQTLISPLTRKRFEPQSYVQRVHACVCPLITIYVYSGVDFVHNMIQKEI